MLFSTDPRKPPFSLICWRGMHSSYHWRRNKEGHLYVSGYYVECCKNWWWCWKPWPGLAQELVNSLELEPAASPALLDLLLENLEGKELKRIQDMAEDCTRYWEHIRPYPGNWRGIYYTTWGKDKWTSG